MKGLQCVATKQTTPDKHAGKGTSATPPEKPAPRGTGQPAGSDGRPASSSATSDGHDAKPAVYEEKKYYVMKPSDEVVKEFKDQLDLTKPEDKGYLPDFKDVTLNDDLILYLVNVQDYSRDDDKYQVQVIDVNTEKIKDEKSTYHWIDYYDSLLFVMESVPARQTKFALGTVFRKEPPPPPPPPPAQPPDTEETRQGIDQADADRDPFLADIPMDRKKFYELVFQVQQNDAKAVEGSQDQRLILNGQVDLESDEVVVKESRADVIERYYNLDKALFDKYGMIYKFSTAYFDITEYFKWVMDRPG
ncbi:MAG: hypothetical protein Q6370_020845 [Candidatus Sigynarchaeota archaeon]